MVKSLKRVLFQCYKISFVKVIDHEKEWKVWCDSETPEEERLPCDYGDNCGEY